MENLLKTIVRLETSDILRKDETLKEFLIEEKAFYILWNATDKIIEVYWKSLATGKDYEKMLSNLVDFANHKTARKILIDQTQLKTDQQLYSEWKKSEMIPFLLGSTQVRVNATLVDSTYPTEKTNSSILSKIFAIKNFDSMEKATKWLRETN
jgi:hypothetical protein